MTTFVMIIFVGTATRLNIKVNPQRRSLKGILILFIEPYTESTKDSETFFIGSIVSFLFNAVGQAIGFLPEHTWLLILAAVAFLLERYVKKDR